MPYDQQTFDLKEILIQSKQDGENTENGVANVVKKSIYQLCCKYLGDDWKSVPLKQVQFSPVGGGTSNLLFLASLPSTRKTKLHCPNKVLIRVYFNPETENNLITESVIFTLLSERRLGPRLYGAFSCGRLEEFVESRPLLTKELQYPIYIKKIARRIAQIHDLSVPINKDPWYIFEAMERWLQQAFQAKTSFDFQLSTGKHFIINQVRLQEEVDSMREMASRSRSPIVFCHNDLQEGNVLLPSESTTSEKDIVLIDYEFAAYNFRAFDFANHFGEWCINNVANTWPHYKINMNDYPSRSQQTLFCEEYLKQRHGSADEILVNSLIEEIRLFVPLPHLFWSIWALVQMEISPIHWGYKEYAAERLSLYFKVKQGSTEDDAHDG